MRHTHSHRPAIEALESRIAPAGIISITPDGKTATWTDTDGDAVTLKVSNGGLDIMHFTVDQTPAVGLLVTKLNLTDALKFAGTKVTLSASRSPLDGGDGTANLGYLDATGVPLGDVSIGGDLGRIDAGSPVLTPETPAAIKSLSVFSMGAPEGTTLPAGVLQTSEIIGKIGSIKVRGNVQGVLLNVTGGEAGIINSLTIGGSLIGTDGGDSGRISASGKIGTIVIEGGILGGSGQHSGSIQAGGVIKSLTVNGSILGGRSDTPSTDGTGVVRSESSIGSVTVLGSIIGGTQQNSGLISAAGDLTKVKIVGSILGGSAGTSSGGIFAGGNSESISIKSDLVGGAADDSGVVRIEGNAVSIKLRGSLIGGSGEGSGSIRLGSNFGDLIELLSIGGDVIGADGEESGTIFTNGTVASLALKRSLIGGTGNGSGSIVASAAVGELVIDGSVLGGDLASTATGDLEGSGLIELNRVGNLTIGGSLIAGEDYSATESIVNSSSIRVQHDIAKLTIGGGVFGNAGNEIFITARGQQQLPLNATSDIAFKSIVIGGMVRHASILAGYDITADATQAEANPNAQVGKVKVSGDWIASNLVAGAAWNENFGDGTDVIASGVDTGILAQIGGVLIGGQIIGTAGNTGDHFGFVAQVINSMTLGGGTPVPDPLTVFLDVGASNDNNPTSLRYNLASTLDVRVFEFA